LKQRNKFCCIFHQIFCSTCTPEQLEKLKLAKIIPVTASQCGLITKSDAERLCSVLLDRSPPLASMSGFHAKSSPFSFRVHHSCFGTCHGIVLPEAYTTPAARCIECLECQGLFWCHGYKTFFSSSPLTDML
jgi:SKI/SNO/DAC family/c-SKI Smad4 binding domain